MPGRIFTLATLFYALLAGAGAAHSWRGLREAGDTSAAARGGGSGGNGVGDWFGGRRGGAPAIRWSCAAPAAEVGSRGPLIDLPTDGASDRVWQYFSTDGFPKIADGNSTFDLPAEDDLRGGMSGFPDRASIEKLRYYGIHTAVLHLQLPTLPGPARL